MSDETDFMSDETDFNRMEHLRAEVVRLREENSRLRAKANNPRDRSEVLLRRVLDVLPVGVFIADEDGGIAWTNPAAERIWGGARRLPVERLSEYKGWWADTGKPVEEWAFARAFKSGESSIDERIDIECFDGSRKTILNSAVPVYDDAGRVISAVAVITDITELQGTEAALRASQERLNRAVDIESVGVLFFDMEGNFLHANDAFLRMIGHDRGELERGELRSARVTLPEWMPRTRQVFQELKETGRFESYAKELVRPDGTRWWGLFAGARLGENEAVEFVIDITERRESERQKEAALEANRQLMRELNHRVKNHLFMVSTLVDLKDESLGSAADLSDIRGQVHTIAHLHEKLYQSDAVSTVELEPYVRGLLTDLFSLGPMPRVDLTVDIGQCPVGTDKATVVGLILNELGTNALKHGFANEATPWFAVTLEARHESEICVMTVQHNGAPLPEDVEAFASGISGLGLVRSLVSQIRGTLDIEGHPRPTFRIVFPIG